MTSEPGEQRATADAAAEALLTTWQLLLGALRHARPLPGAPGVVALVTGAPVPFLNGVWTASLSPDAAAVARDLDACADAGVPFCLQTRPGVAADVLAVAEQRGMRLAGEVPLMLRDGPPPEVTVPPELTVERLDPSEYPRHAAVLAVANQAPPEVMLDLMTAEALALPGMCTLVGRVDGRDVVTAVSLRVGDAVGVFNVGTLPEARGHGYAEVLSGLVVAEGLRAGARWAYLQSSDMALRVYERLGFVTVESWAMRVGGVD